MLALLVFATRGILSGIADEQTNADVIFIHGLRGVHSNHGGLRL